MLKRASKSVGTRIVCVLFMALAVWGQSPLAGEQSPPIQQPASSSGHQVVMLLDISPHQKKVLPVELALAEGIIQKLDQAGNAFSVITFGSQAPRLLKDRITADEAIAAIRGVVIEKTLEKYFSVQFYDALSLAISQFTDDTRSKSLLVISEGNDYFPRKTFNETVAKAQQLQAACDVAMVADHSFYGTKGIQRFGFDLRRFAGKTHGQYIEVGGKEKNIARSVERLSEGILSRRPTSTQRDSEFDRSSLSSNAPLLPSWRPLQGFCCPEEFSPVSSKDGTPCMLIVETGGHAAPRMDA
jgi:hypothetical protein